MIISLTDYKKVKEAKQFQLQWKIDKSLLAIGLFNLVTKKEQKKKR